MELDILLDIIAKYGYIGLFFWLWLGVFGMPVPNEAIVMSVGYASSQNILLPWLTFIITYFGLLAGVTTIYVLGRVMGNPILVWLAKSERRKKHMDKAIQMIEKHHAFSLSMAYFIPGMRNFVPFCFGFSKLPYRKFALYTYSTAFCWLAIMFTLGRKFGENQDLLLKYTQEIIIVSIVIISGVFIMRILRLNKVKKKQTHKKNGEKV